MGTIIVIPTYWGRAAGQSSQPGDAVFDHPTPLDGDSTLPRLLHSLARQEGAAFGVLILTAAVSPELEPAAEERVTEIIAPFRRRFPIAQFAAPDLQLLRERVAAAGFDPALVALRDYASVRNCQLLAPHVLGAEVVVALDDDEVVAPRYVRTATEHIGRPHAQQPVLGVAGFYEDAQGRILLPEGPSTGNLFFDKAAIMNATLRTLQAAPGRLVKTPLALGGNMVFHRQLWARVSFDPWITRGEDIDYLINARLAGFPFFLDKELTITHLPPRHYESPFHVKLRQDVVRFIYEREKLQSAASRGIMYPLAPADLDPYPGRFLRADVDGQALDALREAWPAEAEERPETILAEALDYARRSAPRYFEFARLWPRLLDALGGDEVLSRHLTGKFNGD